MDGDLISNNKDGERLIERPVDILGKATLTLQSDLSLEDDDNTKKEITTIHSIKTPKLTLEELKWEMLYYMLENKLKEMDSVTMAVSNTRIAYKMKKLDRYPIQGKQAQVEFQQKTRRKSKVIDRPTLTQPEIRKQKPRPAWLRLTGGCSLQMRLQTAQQKREETWSTRS